MENWKERGPKEEFLETKIDEKVFWNVLIMNNIQMPSD